MGRRKITIRQIVDPKLRHITFNKRKNGLIKKASELSLLCNVNMLLIFEDGNGNLIQFSKNKLSNIPAFFQECRYSNVVEFCAKDYPNFFKVNHYKKHKQGDFDEFDQDELEMEASTNTNAQLGPINPQNRLFPKNRVQGHIKEEDRDSSKIIYQSGSDDSSNEESDDINAYSESQSKDLSMPKKKQSVVQMKPKITKGDEKQKPVAQEIEMNRAPANEQETSMPQKDSFQSFKEVPQRVQVNKPMDFTQPFMGFEHPFKRNAPVGDQSNPSFRFYPTENANLNVTTANNAYVNTPNYASPHPYMQNGYPNVPNAFTNKQQTPRLRGFGNLNMGNMTNEETLNAMLKGFPPLGFAIGGANPFINKPTSKPEMEEKLLDTANMIKYLNGTGANSYPQQKIFNFHPAEVSKADEVEAMAHMRNNHEGAAFDHEHDYHELPQYVRGDFRLENNMPSNLPSAYFSSKKFNFDGYFNNFEDERFNEFGGDPKKKLKQGQ